MVVEIVWCTRQVGLTREGKRMVKTRTSRDQADLPDNEEPSRSRATSKNDQQAEHPTNVSRILEANMSILLFVLSLLNQRSLNSSLLDFLTFIEISNTRSCPEIEKCRNARNPECLEKFVALFVIVSR